jgi:hypothetical protein
MVVQSVAWLLALDAAAWAVGTALCRRLLDDEAEGLAERLALPLVAGLWILGMSALLLGSVALLRPDLMLVLVGLGVAASVYRVFHERQRLIAQIRQLRPGPASLLSAVVLTAFALACFVPILFHDSLVYHLTIPRVYLEQHRIVPLAQNLFFNMPHNVELLYTWPMSWGGIPSAMLLSFQFSLLILAGCAWFASRHLKAPLAGLLALLYLASPSVRNQLASTNVETGMGCFLLYGFLLLLRWLEDWRPATLASSFALIGWAMACKYTAWLFALGPITVLALAVLADPELQGRRLRVAGLAGLSLVVPLAPWLIKNYLVTGNPVYPNAFGLLGGKWWSAIQSMQLLRSMAYVDNETHSRSLITLLTLPWDLAVSHMYGGSIAISLVLLFLGLALVPSSSRASRRALLLGAVPGVLGWAVSPAPKLRFLVAMVPLLVLGAGLTLDWLASALRFRRVYAVALVAIVVDGASSFTMPAPNWSVFSEAGYRAVLEANNLFPLWKAVERVVPRNGTVFAMFENRVLFLDRPFWVDSAYEAPSCMAFLRQAGTPAAAARRMLRAGITHLVVQWNVAKAYFDQTLPIQLVDPVLLPQRQFDRERQMFFELLSRHAVHLFDVGDHGVYELRPGAAPSERSQDSIRSGSNAWLTHSGRVELNRIHRPSGSL